MKVDGAMKQALASKGKAIVVLAAMLLVLALSFSTAGAANNFLQTNLVSDLPGLAKITDPDLVNPWGISLQCHFSFMGFE